jgi:hypothetical protein
MPSLYMIKTVADLQSICLLSFVDQQHLILSTEVSKKRREVVNSHQIHLNDKSISGKFETFGWNYFNHIKFVSVC